MMLATGVHATVQRERLEDTYCTEQEHGWDRPPSHYSRTFEWKPVAEDFGWNKNLPSSTKPPKYAAFKNDQQTNTPFPMFVEEAPLTRF